MDNNQSPYIQYLKARGKLVTVDLSDEEIMRQERRCGGDCVCEECGKIYYDHPYIANSVDWEGRPFLHLICNGTIAKL